MGGAKMAAFARFLSHAIGNNVDVETVKPIIIFCGIGLLVSLLFLIYDFDLSAGLF
jgi:hypothetical protein